MAEIRIKTAALDWVYVLKPVLAQDLPCKGEKALAIWPYSCLCALPLGHAGLHKGLGYADMAPRKPIQITW